MSRSCYNGKILACQSLKLSLNLKKMKATSLLNTQHASNRIQRRKLTPLLLKFKTHAHMTTCRKTKHQDVQIEFCIFETELNNVYNDVKHVQCKTISSTYEFDSGFLFLKKNSITEAISPLSDKRRILPDDEISFCNIKTNPCIQLETPDPIKQKV